MVDRSSLAKISLKVQGKCLRVKPMSFLHLGSTYHFICISDTGQEGDLSQAKSQQEQRDK